MNQRFRGIRSTDIRNAKLDAAKSSLFRQIAPLTDEDIAIVEFNSIPRLFYRGKSSNLSEREIQKLQADGETDIAAALRYVI